MKIHRVARKVLRIAGIVLILLLFVFVGLMWWGASAMSRAAGEVVSELNAQPGAAFLTRKLTIDGIQVRVIMEEEEKDSTALLLFVHGSPGSFDNFLPYFEDPALRQRFLMASYDRPGYGVPALPAREWTLQGQSELLASLIRQMDAPGTILIGHSYGCSVIAELTATYPDLVDHAVLVAPPLDPAFEKGLYWRRLIDGQVFRWILPPPFRVSNRELTELKEGLVELSGRLRDVQTPTTVIQGSQDRLVPSGNVDYMHRMYPEDMLHVEMMPDRNHFILWTERARISGILRSLRIL